MKVVLKAVSIGDRRDFLDQGRFLLSQSSGIPYYFICIEWVYIQLLYSIFSNSGNATIKTHPSPGLEIKSAVPL
jgi:hypothetical protein